MIQTFFYAIESIRSNLFHTFLSILGIIIGVAALVSILTVIDGMESLARDQITRTSSLNSIVVSSQTHKEVNGVRLKKDTLSLIDFQAISDLGLSKPIASIELSNQISTELEFSGTGKKIGVVLMPSSTINIHDSSSVIGNLYTIADIQTKSQVILVSDAFATILETEKSDLVNRELVFGDQKLKIVGVVPDGGNETPRAMIPISLLSPVQLNTHPPYLIVTPMLTEDIDATKDEIRTWLDKRYGDVDKEFSIRTNDFRVRQVLKGFLVFRIVMGLIVGISVLVGGIGVMNVLLISVTNRTAEIGIRKAVGAKPRDIANLFIAESISISFLGSIIGIIIGASFTMIFTPIVSRISELPFHAEFTWTTMFIIAVVALIVGVVFGTYPAIRASRLDPVDAIRHE